MLTHICPGCHKQHEEPGKCECGLTLWPLEYTSKGANMAYKAGCNHSMAKPSGSHSTRMNPNDFARNNMAKGGVNNQTTFKKMPVPAGKAGKG